MKCAIGFTCPMCGAIFLLKARFDVHREAEIPSFAVAQAAKRAQALEQRRQRQQEIGRLDAEGSYIKDWRP